MFSQAYRAVRTGTRAATTAAVGETSATITPRTPSSTSNGPEEEVAQRRVYANQAKSTSDAQPEEGSKAAVSQQESATAGVTQQTQAAAASETKTASLRGVHKGFFSDTPIQSKRKTTVTGPRRGGLWKVLEYLKLVEPLTTEETIISAEEPTTSTTPIVSVQQRAPRNPGLQPRPLIQPGFQLRRYSQSSEGPEETAYKLRPDSKLSFKSQDDEERRLDKQMEQSVGAPMDSSSLWSFIPGTQNSKIKQLDDAMFAETNDAYVIKNWGTLSEHSSFLSKGSVVEFKRALAGSNYNPINSKRLFPNNSYDRQKHTLLYENAFLTVKDWLFYGEQMRSEPSSRYNDYRSSVLKNLFIAGARLDNDEKELIRKELSAVLQSKITESPSLDTLQKLADLVVLLNQLGVDVAQIGTATINVDKAKLFRRLNLEEPGPYSIDQIELMLTKKNFAFMDTSIQKIMGLFTETQYPIIDGVRTQVLLRSNDTSAEPKGTRYLYIFDVPLELTKNPDKDFQGNLRRTILQDLKNRNELPIAIALEDPLKQFYKKGVSYRHGTLDPLYEMLEKDNKKEVENMIPQAEELVDLASFITQK